MSLMTTYTFTNSDNYTYDSEKIIFDNGKVKLNKVIKDAYIWYPCNENNGSTLIDYSGNNRNATANKTPTWDNGKLGYCPVYDTSLYFDAGNVADFDRTDPFSIEFWYKSSTSQTVNMIASKQDPDTGYRGWICYIYSGYIRFFLINDYDSEKMIKCDSYVGGLNDGNWHHIVITYDGSSKANGVKMYIDGSNVSIYILKDNLDYPTTNNGTLKIGANSSLNYFCEGYIDEFLIYDFVLSADRVNQRYNSGNGQGVYYTDNPVIYPNGTINTDELLSISETADLPENTEIRYILQKDGVDYYWDGAQWTTSDGTYSQSNDLATVNTNITDFLNRASIVRVKVLLCSSDGVFTPELDEITVKYDFTGDPADQIDKCVVYGRVYDANGAPLTEPIYVYPHKKVVKYKTQSIIFDDYLTFTPDNTGYFEMPLVENENMEEGAYYNVLINGKMYKIVVPNQVGVKFWDIVQ